MKHLLCLIVLLSATTAFAAGESKTPNPPIHAVTDISHTFSFYFDHRFAKQYILPSGGVEARNWGTLHKYDLSNVNLLILQTGASPCVYFPEDVKAVQRFLDEGGGVVILGDRALFRDEKKYHLNDLATALGAEVVDIAAKTPLKASKSLGVDEVKTYGGKTIRLTKPNQWDVIVRDAKGAVVMARRNVGKGRLLVTSRGLSGHNPNASDPINDGIWIPALVELSSGKQVNPKRKPQSAQAENEVDKGGLKLRYSDYLQPFADEIVTIYQKALPEIEAVMGVPASAGMLASLILLPTGGGGFSSGRNVGLGVWWGGFPDKRYGMIELIGHEGCHSWVLPFAEPMWNEGIATYVGIRIAHRMGESEGAERSLTRWIANAKKLDPDMTKFDIAHGKDVPHVVKMAKPMWIFEELRKEQADILATYFQTKRRLIDPAKRKRYTAEDCVAVLSIAMGRDLFPWFRSLGVTVDAEDTDIEMKFID